ncbi:SWIM zinc finger protein [Seiridium cupressi]
MTLPSPSEQFSQLSIESMPPTTRLQSRNQRNDPGVSDDGSSDSDQADDYICFPSKLIYTLENLDENLRQHVFDAIEEPPQIVLQECGARDEYDIFQVSELMHFTIRTGSDKSRWPRPRCSCGGGSSSRYPCRHILWLCDQITSQLLDNRDGVLSLNQYGYSDTLGNPYDRITSCHLDILADDLHSRVQRTPPDPEDVSLSPRRAEEVREILASLNRTPVEEYRPDIFDNPTAGMELIKRNDLECTIFRMLCQNNEFFQYFLSSMKSDELVNNTFRKLQKRADAALAGLDAFAKSASEASRHNPKDVRWCASHLHLIVQKIQTAILRARRPLEAWESQAAARTLLHILREVVNRSQDPPPPTLPQADRNLYLHLIGDRDRNFVIDALSCLTPEGLHPLAEELERIMFDMQKLGVPITYVGKLRNIHKRARRARNIVPH